MITSINAFNTNKAQNNQSFGMAYRIDNRWSELFEAPTEKKFLSKLINNAKTKALDYVGNDGITHHFKTFDGDVFFTKEGKGIMSNVKFIPNNTEQEGFYIINNNDKEICEQYSEMTALLKNIIKKDSNNFIVTKSLRRTSGNEIYQVNNGRNRYNYWA